LGQFESAPSAECPTPVWSVAPEQHSWPDAEAARRHSAYLLSAQDAADGIPLHIPPCRPVVDDLTSARRDRGHTCRVPAHSRRRRARKRPRIIRRMRILASLAGALTALAATTVILAFWVSSSDSLRGVAASHTSTDLARVWPVVIYGPWITACVSSLIRSFDHRRVAHSWIIVTIFSAVAASVCSVDSFGVPSGILFAGLPPIAAAISFHQFMGQIAALKTISSRRLHARSS
jgi:hypothetical protein